MSARTSSYFAGASWGLDAFFALVVSAPVVASLRAQWPHLGAEALVAPGGLEIIETLAQRGPVFSSAALVFVLLALARWAAGLLVEVAHARALGSALTSERLALRMVGVRVIGAIPTGMLFAAAFSPAYAVREAPIASLGTQGNVLLALGLAVPSLALVLVSMGAERLARALVAHEETGVTAAWLRAIEAMQGGGSPALRFTVGAAFGSLALGAVAAFAAKFGYGVGLVLAQALLFAGSYLRTRAFAFAFTKRV